MRQKMTPRAHARYFDLLFITAVSITINRVIQDFCIPVGFLGVRKKKKKVNASLGRHGYWSNEFLTKDHEIGFEDHDQTLKSERPLVNFHWKITATIMFELWYLSSSRTKRAMPILKCTKKKEDVGKIGAAIRNYPIKV